MKSEPINAVDGLTWLERSLPEEAVQETGPENAVRLGVTVAGKRTAVWGHACGKLVQFEFARFCWEAALKTFEELSRTLASSGVTLLAVERTVTSCPPQAAHATSCGPQDGRVDIVVEYGSPDPLQEVDDAWFGLASRFGLFGESGEFLLMVNLHDDEPYDSDLYWARVRLQEQWTVAGSNRETINGPALDGLATMSPTGDVIIVGTKNQKDLSVLAVPRPHRASAIRKFAQFMLRNGELTTDEADNVKRWLARD
ncbi:hypothetical protein OHB54_45655 [Streptomyces sp. NBC_01007]|nr:hypothetical protein OHB54_45655 [Streptomyces sp. NBC_01007]